MFAAFFKKIKRLGRIFGVSAKKHVVNLNGQRAVALTYYTLFSIVPVVAMFFGIAKGFNLDDKLQTALNERFAHQEEILRWIYHFINTTLARASGGIVAGIGVLALLWTVLSLAGNIEAAVNAVWGVPPRRNLLRRFNDYVTLVIIIPIILVVVGSAGVFARRAFESFVAASPMLDESLLGYFDVFVMIVPTILTCGVFFLLYYFAPNTRVRVRPALFAGVIAGIAYQLMQQGFVVLQKGIFNYNHIYGSFAVLPLFLIWVQWAWQIALFGAEISFVTQNIDTGLFDHETHLSASMHLLRLQQLAVSKIIFANLESGKGATPWSEIEHRLGIAAVEIDRAVAGLLEAGIIERTGRDRECAFLPAISAGNSTVLDCLVHLDSYGRDAVPDEMKKESDEIEKTLAVFRETVKKDPVNQPLCKL